MATRALKKSDERQSEVTRLKRGDERHQKVTRDNRPTAESMRAHEVLPHHFMSPNSCFAGYRLKTSSRKVTMGEPLLYLPTLYSG